MSNDPKEHIFVRKTRKIGNDEVSVEYGEECYKGCGESPEVRYQILSSIVDNILKEEYVKWRKTLKEP